LKRNFAEVEDMAERTEGKQMWKRKHYLAEAAARACTAKAARGTSLVPRLLPSFLSHTVQKMGKAWTI